jgi:RNA polymerase sigma-70 factor (ECF subfamily)
MEQNSSSGCAEDIVYNYGTMVSSICRRMLRNEEDAKDAAQEAWAQILKGLPKFRGDAKLSTWIYTVTYHTVMRYSRQEKTYSTRFLRDYFHGEQREVPCEIDYDRNIWIKEMCDKCLTGILHCLDGEGRIAYLFRDMVQLSYEEISQVLDKDPASARQIVSRCRRKLRSFLNDECALFNPEGKCRCRMKNLVEGIELPQEYMKLRKFINRANVYLESQRVLPQKNYWENLL